MKTTNCHIKDTKPNDVYCGRGRGMFWNPLNCTILDKGYWGNPIVIGKKCFICSQSHNDGGNTLPCYEKYLTKRLKEEYDFRTYFFQLRGKRLVCFCKPKPCHTDVMIKYLEQ